MNAPVPVSSNRPRRLLIVNPNTNRAVTDQVREAARAVAPPQTRIEVVNPERGPFAIETASDRAQVLPEILALVARSRDAGFDACILACFDDIGIEEARKLVSMPVISLFGAAMARARRIGKPFAIVTTVETATPGLEKLTRAYGMDHMCTIRAAGIGVAEAAARTPQAEERLFDTIHNAIRDDRAEAIVLGSGALTGRAPALEHRFGIPFVDGLTVAVTASRNDPDRPRQSPPRAPGQARGPSRPSR